MPRVTTAGGPDVIQQPLLKQPLLKPEGEPDVLRQPLAELQATSTFLAAFSIQIGVPVVRHLCSLD